MRKSKPRTETRASQSRELGELSALARETVERKQKRLPDSPECIRPNLSWIRRAFLFFYTIRPVVNRHTQNTSLLNKLFLIKRIVVVFQQRSERHEERS